MAIEKLREGGKKTGKIIGYKVRLPGLNGSQWTTKTFTRKEYPEPLEKAKQWQVKQKKERKLRRDGFNTEELNKEKLENWSVRELIEGYLDSPESRELQDNLSQSLLKFALPIWKKSLFDLTHQVAKKHVNDMLAAKYTSEGSEIEKRYSPDTIRRNISVVQRAWKWGQDNVPDLSPLTNPWEGISFPGTGRKRQRGLRKGELEKLEKASEKLRGSNRYYVPLAIYIAVDTAMRRQEIFDLTWQDIDFDNRRINIKHDKNSWRRQLNGLPKNRLICLPPTSLWLLGQLAASLQLDGLTPGLERFPVPKEFHPPAGKILMGFEKKPMTGNGFKQLFEQVRDWAGIADIDPRKQLTPHSLRAAAEMGYHKAGMLEKPIDVQKNGIKTHYDVEEDLLEIVQNTLDKAYFGKPFDEALKEYEGHEREYQALCKAALQAGATAEIAVDAAVKVMFEKYPQYPELKAKLASLPSTQARLAEEV